MRKVSDITPIEGADRIETIHVDGWTVVDRKNVWKVGDFCVYLEVDTFVPTNEERYAFLRGSGEKTMVVKGVPTVGSVLRTRKFKGQYSQGLVMKPEDVLPSTVPESAYEKMYQNHARLDGICHVCEYEPDDSALSAGFIGKYDPYIAPRTDAERLQNVSDDTFDEIMRSDYLISVKVDGTSITMVYDPRVSHMRVFSHNNEFDLSIPGIGMTAANCAKEQGIWEYCESHPGVTIQGELCGTKIQGNPLRLMKHRLYVFSVWDMKMRGYLNPYDIDELVMSTTPMLNETIDSLTKSTPTRLGLIDAVDGIRGNVTGGCLDEGVVIHVLGKGALTDEQWMELRNALGLTMQAKVISNRYLLKHGA